MAHSPVQPNDQPGDALPSREEVPFVSRRLLLLFLMFFMVMGVFAGQVYHLTVLQGPYFRSEADNNFRTEVPILAPRGKIYDRNGLPLAINRRVYDVSMSPFNLKADEITSTVARLADLLGRPELRKMAGAVAKCYPRWSSVVLASDLSTSETIPVFEQGFLLPGVIVQRSYDRTYPAGADAGNVTGHVGLINSKQLADYEARGYLRNEKIGKLNAELTFEDLLHGTNGEEVVFRDARGKPRSSPEIATQAQPGDTLVLTLDLRLQHLAQQLLGDQKGVIIAMDPRDGAVLAMAQTPTYDPNYPAARGSSQFNKIDLAGSYPPGSTFKIVTASAGLDAGFDPEATIECDGYITLGKARFYCDLRSGHGPQNLVQAIQHSCNIFFYTWASRVGAQGMVDAASAYGFGRPTGFELAAKGHETAGILARPGIDAIYPGSVMQMGIGQGSMIGVSPIQLAGAYAALANGGTVLRPRIVLRVENSMGQTLDVPPYGAAQPVGKLPITPEQRAMIVEGLKQVVQKRGGTAVKVGFKPEWNVAGKTGTAQTGEKGVEPHAWFVGFAPADNPQIVVLALVERSGHGGAMAAPLVRQMMAAYFGEPEPNVVPAGAPDPAAIEGGDGEN